MKFLVLVLLGVVSVAAYRINWRHKGISHEGWHPHGYQRPLERHKWRSHVPWVNIEIFEPKGLKVSMVHKKQIDTMFGVELFINTDPRLNDSECDLCQNTTTITYGKFIIEDRNVIIKKKDQLIYFVLVGNSTKVTRFPMRKLTVTGSLIKKCDYDLSIEQENLISNSINKLH
ncbi:uncharacterized protein LOC129728065 [Wyeomyia smithii]|uniref:uncharacterized protein LOC129728065 n=1 Tax=Wyeomyia smithii TaxID=174621 RepID=UPI002467DF3C|nr:uncharacterized protein LOC129728065 [Wyeomyia smithii]